jgi:arylsulfatase
MNRRNFLSSLTLAAAAVAAGRGTASAQPAPAPLAGRRPNIVFIMTDDQGLGDMAWTGHPNIRTPNLDALRTQSLWLSEFHASPTCAPTRCSLMTGRHEFFSGVTHTIFERERMSLKAFTLPQALKSAGYATGIFGKWHLGDEDPYQPGKRGFDEAFIHGGGGIGQTYPGSCGDAPNNAYFSPVIRHNGTFERTKGFCTDVFFDRALQWIDQRRKTSEPFFCYLTPNAPHGPYAAPAKWTKRYLEQGLDDDGAGFCGMVENIDWNVGRLLAKIDEWGLAQNTLVIFLGDNGTCQPRLFNGGMRGAKGTPFQGGTRVGLLARWKGVLPEGATCPALAAHIDLFPTLCALAGATPPADKTLDGRSLLPLMQSPQAPWEDRLLFTHVGRWKPGTNPDDAKYKECAVRTPRFRFVNNTALYELAADPMEKQDVASKYPEEVSRLRAAYEAWWAEVRPCMENENPQHVPAQNPYKTAYWQQFGH